MVSKSRKPALGDDTQYEVKLVKAVKYGRTWLRPSSEGVILKGKVIKELGDVVGEVRAISE